MAISSALDPGLIARALGYQLKKGEFNPEQPYLYQKVVILGEGNHANQANFDETAFDFVNSKEVGDRFGYGSVVHDCARILKGIYGSRIGSIPTSVFPQLEADGATATVIKKSVTVATTVTENATHTLVINGRKGIDGVSYSYNVVKGETAAQVVAKIIATVQKALSCPMTAAISGDDIDFTSKVYGLSSAENNITFDVNKKPAGIVYAEVSKTDGAGVPAITNALTLLGGNVWNTLVINPYGTAVFDELELLNGVPDVENPTGRYLATQWMPFMSVWGSRLSDKDDIVAITDAEVRKTQLTHKLAPCPNSPGFTWEAAANSVAILAPTFNNSPHAAISGQQYPDMPIPVNENIGDFGTLEGRDFMNKRGASTVTIENGAYTIQNDMTTYHPDGDSQPLYRNSRDVNLHWTKQYSWRLVMAGIQDKTIIEDGQSVSVPGTITLQMISQKLKAHNEEMANLAIITDLAFSNNNENIQIGISSGNPRRLEISNKYKITSTADQVDTTMEAGFYYGQNT